ncbi:MAG: ATP-binding protein [Treponema sp.]|nr:ATP-binding protein [Treponema sp.]
MVQRIEYLKRLEKWQEKQQVKVISGVRGCGKTTLLALYIDQLKRSGVEDGQIMYISMDDPESESLLHYQGLYSYIKKRLCKEKCTYIFIDEMQKCAQYEKAIDGLLLKNQVNVFVAVSGSYCFTDIPHIEIKILPLSFAEHLIFAKVRNRSPQIPAIAPQKPEPLRMEPLRMERRLPRQKAQVEKYLQREAFHHYLSFGGFPFAATLGGDAGLVRQCVEGIYHTILIKDVARQAGIHDIPLLEHIARVMSHSIGLGLNAKKISAEISVKGKKITADTVETYMQALVNACVFYFIGRFDIKIGKRLKTLGKYYIADTGIQNLLLEKVPDLNGQLENIVCMELLRRGFQVYIGKYGNDEISFVAVESSDDSADNISYFQVMAAVRDNPAYAGKFSALEQIPGNHPKYIISLDQTPFRSHHNGITQRNLIEWLIP